MPKRRHHFVPRFYLAAFQSAPRRVNVLSVDATREIRDASLRHQCHKRKLYGNTDTIEDALAVVEGRAARVLARIQSTETLPPVGSEDDEALRALVAFQLLRTVTVAARMNTAMDKMTKQAHSHDERFSKDELESVHFGLDDPVLLAIANVPNTLVATADLKSHLTTSAEGVFITSDNPAFKYNQYCEGIDYQGITGSLAKGLQIFFPLTPKLCFVLYDGAIYSVPRSDRRIRRTVASPFDVAYINTMQLLSADHNVYFSDWERRRELQDLRAHVRHHRMDDPTVVVEYGHDTDPNRSLLHTFERTPNLKLSLSFMKVRWRARSVSLHDRAHGYRKEVPMSPIPEPPEAYRGPATFSRFLGRR